MIAKSGAPIDMTVVVSLYGVVHATSRIQHVKIMQFMLNKMKAVFFT